MKKVRTHRKDRPRGMWQAGRMEGKVRKLGASAVKKPKGKRT